MDKIPLWREDDVRVGQLVEDYAQYLYLQRLKDPEVLLTAIREGVGMMTWETDTFAYAESRDAMKKRYCGLQAGRLVHISRESTGLLVKSSVAAKQLAAETSVSTGKPTVPGEPPTGIEIPGSDGRTVAPEPEPPKATTRFYGTVKIDATRMSRDVATISNEVVQHLVSQLGADVEITLEIQARIPEGIPENIVRTVSENCRTLKFDSQGFEQE